MPTDKPDPGDLDSDQCEGFPSPLHEGPQVWLQQLICKILSPDLQQGFRPYVTVIVDPKELCERPQLPKSSGPVGDQRDALSKQI